MKSKSLKIFSLLMVVLCMMFSLAACGDKNSADISDEENLTTSEITVADITTSEADEDVTVNSDKNAENEDLQNTSAAVSTTKADKKADGDNTADTTKKADAASTTKKADNKEATKKADAEKTTAPVKQTGTSKTAVTEKAENKADSNKNQTPAAPDSSVQTDKKDTADNTGAEDSGFVQPDTQYENISSPKGEYNKGIVLVKVKDSFRKADMGTVKYVSAEPLYNGSKWYSVQLKDAEKTEDAVTYLASLGTFAEVDYDYLMGVTANEKDNPNYDSQSNLGLSNIPNGWTQNDKHPGGSSDVVVAVIDTGVDYNHLDLHNNIWINSAEIPDNGKDDDGNGYIDDIYGWDCVGNDNDPMDDNGHGTHVAGIIAAENNKLGGIGVAYNSKVMVLKAGNSSGYFNNSDIAEAIQYAYMNGASVINMSFGGSFISVAVEEALENAYNTCVLVAAAGNDGACNDLACDTCDIRKVTYPAALPYVIGVMSTDKDGKHISSFSNYDHNPYNSIEYEVYAVGEGVGSTWPSNKYACLNGTSMAAPTVSGIAALLRSSFSDREVYSTKFIQSQIVNTGTVNPHILDHVTDAAHSVADVVEVLTKLPKPAVNLYGYTINDSTSLSSKNNGNGVIDAGETVRLSIALHNRGGVASDVNVSIDTDRGMGTADPYFTFVNSTMQLSDIGTYSVRESGDEKYFEIIVSENCPNDYLIDFNIRYTYRNGLDDKDKTLYEDDGKQTAQFNVSSGYHLPSIINEDTTFVNDRLYIVSENVMIPAGVTVTFEEGCRIQFYDDSEYFSSPRFIVYGTLYMEGSKEAMITINPSERYSTFACIIENRGTAEINYVDAINLFVSDNQSGSSTISDSKLITNGKGASRNVYYYNGGVVTPIYDGLSENIGSIYNSYVEIAAYGYSPNVKTINGCYIFLMSGNRNALNCTAAFTNNILYSEFNTSYSPIGSTFSGTVINNLFLSCDDEDPQTLIPLTFKNPDKVLDNTFSAGYQQYASQVITNYLDSTGTPTVEVFGCCSDISKLHPYVTNVEIFNADGEQITTIGKEEITVRITFNRAMDTEKDVSAYFGTIAPYSDYKVEGEFVSDTVWEGSYTLKSYIENGLQYLIVKGACAAEDETKKVYGENHPYVFNIDTTAAMSMSLFAEATDTGIELTWAQDDYDTLMGYNIYRSTSKDGNYVKINPSVLLASDTSFTDENAEPGTTYWYTFTVVLSDFSESAPAGKVFCTAVDNLNPTVYHTPVNQGYVNNNLVISCTASDNMKIANVTLFYRTYGDTEWSSAKMSKLNDKYSATVFGSTLTLDGLEYYIVASDGSNTVSKGTADEPYFVVIKDSSAISRIGDVDGNGLVDTKDALMIMQCINGDLIMTDDEFKRADLNKDDVLSSVEALRILQYINGNVPSLEM